MSDDKPAPSKIIPNTFQTPNLFTDEGLMALLSGSETKCYIVIVRKTFGWRKDKDRIAKSQIVTATGLSDDTVDTCMAALVKFGLVLRTAENNPANEGVEWAPQMDETLIDLKGLQERQSAAKSSNSKKTEKARIKRGGVVQHPPLVQHPQGGVVQHPPLVQHPQGGVVQHPPQQPITASSLVVINAGTIFENYEKEFGGTTPMVRDMIIDAIDTYPIEWIPEAMQIAVSKNVRAWSYVEGILKKCKAKNIRPSLNKLEAKNGNYGNGNKQGSRPKQQAAKPASVESNPAKLAEINRRRKLKQQPARV